MSAGKAVDLHVLAAFNALREVYTFDEAVDWLRSSHGLLDDRRPVDLIYEGEVDRVMAVIALLADGAFA